MSNSVRIVLRNRWKSDHPAQFNRANKERTAMAYGGKLAPRLTFTLWCLKTFRPARYAELLAKVTP